MNEEQERNDFEGAVYRAYFIAHISSELTLKCPLVSKAKLCEIDADSGCYVDDAVQQAWLGWSLRAKK